MLVAAAVDAQDAADAGTPEAADALVPDAGFDAGLADEATDDGDEADDDDDDEANAAPGVDPEAESHEAAPPPGTPGIRYSADLSDEELARRWKSDLESLGPISVGFADSGRLINGVPFPKQGNWTIVSPESSYGTKAVIDTLVAAITEVCERFPGTPPLRINHISRKDGGWLRPHRSHQSGRDADLAFFYPTADPIRVREREKYIDVPRNWALVRALVTHGDVQVILVDRRVQKVLYDHALSIGEDKAWLDSLFRSGKDAILQHARRHRDHFHVRFFDGRAQELGRRVQPLLAQRPEHNVITHRIRSGDTLGHIARRYDTTVQLIMRANGLRRSFLRAGRMLSIPLRKPCTKCPLPPEVFVPPRRLPPELAEKTAAASPSVEEPAAAAAGTN